MSLSTLSSFIWRSTFVNMFGWCVDLYTTRNNFKEEKRGSNSSNFNIQVHLFMLRYCQWLALLPTPPPACIARVWSMCHVSWFVFYRRLAPKFQHSLSAVTLGIYLSGSMEEDAGKDPGYSFYAIISRCYKISACYPSKTKLINSMQKWNLLGWLQ
jgi:hypothetical protein